MTAIAASTIAAQAFRFMEMDPIGSFADGSPQAAAAAEQYPAALDFSLEAHDWSFARKLAALPQIVGVDGLDPDLPFRYSLPSDCVRLRKVCTSWSGYRWRQDGRIIRSNQALSLDIRYTFRIQNEALLPASFQTVVSLALAVRLMPVWVSSRTKRADVRKELTDAIAAAWTADQHSASYERMDGRPEQPDWACEAVKTGQMNG